MRAISRRCAIDCRRSRQSRAFAGIATAWQLKPAPPTRELHLAIAPPADSQFMVGRNIEGGLAVSPDGRMLAFVASTNARSQLWIRRFDAPEPYAIGRL